MPEFSDDVCHCEQCQRTQDIYDYHLATERVTVRRFTQSSGATWEDS